MILVFPTFSTANFFLQPPGKLKSLALNAENSITYTTLILAASLLNPFQHFHWKQTNHIVPQPAEPAGDSAELLLSTSGSGGRLRLVTNCDAKIEV